MKKEIVFAYLGLILMTIIIGFSFVFIKVALNTASPYDVLAHRFSVAAMALLLYYAFVRRKKPEINKKNFFHFYFILILSIAIISLQTIGLKFTTVLEAEYYQQ